MKLRLSIYVIRCIAYGKVRNVEQLANAPRGVYMFSYQGTTKCHLVSTLIPIETKKTKLCPDACMRYWYGSTSKVHQRCIMDGLDTEIVATFRRVLSQEILVEMFLRAGEFINEEVLNVRLASQAGPRESICEYKIYKRVKEVVAILLWNGTRYCEPARWRGWSGSYRHPKGEGVGAVATGTRRVKGLER